MPDSSRTEPVLDELSDRYWQAAAERKLLVQRCRSTGRCQWYPRAHSVHDFHAEVEWVEASGRGRLYSYSVTHRTQGTIETPFVFALVELDEGVHVSCNIVGVPLDELEIGMPLEVTFEPIGDDLLLPQFTGRAGA